ncbi:unnamed protein product [Sphagnum jensenii]|uniref:H15 domain-containing protein n=1 Tax=Sphagnum jensenii TaxID=128206 RepID=A0ABP1BRD7_9BRYO
MASVTDDVAVASATVAVVEEVVVPSSGTEKEEVEVEVNGNSKVVEKAAAVVKEKRVNAPREKKAKATVPKEKKQKQEKVVKEKKPKIAKAANPSAAASHPSYLLMVKEAIGSLKERTGSSQHAIAKYLEEVYKTGLPPNFKKILSVRLRNMTKQGKVYKVKNSFKLSEELKKPMMIRRKADPNKSTLSIKGDSNKEMDVLKPIKASKPKSQNRVKKTTTTTIIDGVPVPKSPKPAKAPKAPKFEKPSKLPKPGAKPRKLSVTATKKGGEKKFTPPAVAAAAVATTTKPALVSSLTSKKASGVRKTAAKKLLTPKKSTKSVKTSKSKGVIKALPGAPSNKAVAKKAKK